MNIVLRPLLVALWRSRPPRRRIAQGWPERPIKFISSQAAGGGTDAIGRLVADQLAARLGQPIVYENRPGGGNVIGTQAAARSAPTATPSSSPAPPRWSTDPHTYKSLPYDPMRDFTTISSIAEVSFMVLAHPSVPAKTLPELIAYAKAEPEKLAVATDGARRFSGMIAAWINKLAGTAISYVPYTQMTQGVQDALAGRVQLVILAVPTARGAHRGRHAAPVGGDVGPPAGGLPRGGDRRRDLSGLRFRRLVGARRPHRRAGRDPAAVNREMDAILKDPAVTGRMSNAGFISRGGGTIDETRAYVQAQHAAWGKLVQEIGLQPE